MRNSKRIWLYVILGVVLVGGIVTAVFYKSGKSDPAKQEYGELRGEIKNCTDSLLIISHYSDSVYERHYSDGHCLFGKIKLYDTVKINEGKFYYRYLFKKSPRVIGLYTANMGQKSKDIILQNQFYDRPYGCCGCIFLENGRKIFVKIPGDFSEEICKKNYGSIKGSPMTDSLFKRYYAGDLQEKFHKLTHGKVTDPKIIKLFSANRFIFEGDIYKRRTEYNPDTLQLILDNFDPFIRDSYLGRKLKGYIRQEKSELIQKINADGKVHLLSQKAVAQ